jgi:hypothetical protein
MLETPLAEGKHEGQAKMQYSKPLDSGKLLHATI